MPTYPGGYLRSQAIDDDGRCYCLAWGHIGRVKPISKLNFPAVAFNLRVAKGLRFSCAVYGYGQTQILARRLKQNDKVICAGTMRVRDYYNAKGNLKKSVLFDVAYIIPQKLINRIVDEGLRDVTPDIFEGEAENPDDPTYDGEMTDYRKGK